MKKVQPIFISLIIGSAAGLLFIILQPTFGMSTLTSRHAEHYINFGQYSATMAAVLAWFIHLAVSWIYALSVLFVFHLSRNIFFVSFSVIFLGWFTTVIAPIANFIILNAVSKGTILGFDKWPHLNFHFDEKLVLHLLFFAFIALAMRPVYPTNNRK